MYKEIEKAFPMPIFEYRRVFELTGVYIFEACEFNIDFLWFKAGDKCEEIEYDVVNKALHFFSDKTYATYYQFYESVGDVKVRLIDHKSLDEIALVNSYVRYITPSEDVAAFCEYHNAKIESETYAASSFKYRDFDLDGTQCIVPKGFTKGIAASELASIYFRGSETITLN